MSTTSTTTPARSSGGAPRLTARGVVHSEWLRLSTTRSTSVTMVATGVVMALIGMLAALVATGSVADPAGGPAPAFDATDPVGTLMTGSTMVVLLVAVLGVMVGAREYGSGLVRTTYAAVPRRWPVLLARSAVFAGAAFVVIGLGVAVAYAGGNALLAANDATTASLAENGVVRALLGNVAFLVAVGVIGVALGSLSRSIGLGIGAVIALVIVVPGLGSALLPDGWQGALDVLPSQAALSLTSVTAPEGQLGLAAGSAVLTLWVVGLLGAATVTLLRRDV